MVRCEIWISINSNDWYPDIYVGRLSPSNLTTLNIMLQRNLEYDITPDTSSYYKRAIGLGSNEGAGYGDDGEADWQHLGTYEQTTTMVIPMFMNFRMVLMVDKMPMETLIQTWFLMQ